MSKRLNDRLNNCLRDISITRGFTKHAEGSVLIKFGATQIICTATIDNTVPKFLQGKGTGWVTAEYSMLPRATHTRNKRDAVIGKVSARSQEISRLIGRSLRNAVDLSALGERQIIIDCDVIQADGGTRTASITGAFIALYDAITLLLQQGKLRQNPIKQFIAAISVGVVAGEVLLDLDYEEDSNCDLDMNVVMLENMTLAEIQGTAEKTPCSRDTLNTMLDVAQAGIEQLIQQQKLCLGLV